MTVVQYIRPPQNIKIPQYLIKETLNGRDLPYKGYKDVLTKKKQAEEVMGCSSLQAVLVSIINAFLFTSINRKKYLIASNEAGLHISKKNNLSNDIAIFDRKSLILTDKFFNKAPKIAIEIDVRVDLNPETHADNFSYVVEKAKKMIEFGTEKLVWIMTHNKTVLVFSKTETWSILNFDTDIHLLDDCTLNLAKLLDEEEIDF